MKIFKCFIIFAVILSLTSCSKFYSGSFDGGELLDDKLMSSIKSELFSTEETQLDAEEITSSVNETSDNDLSANSSEITHESATDDHLSECSSETISESATTEYDCDTETIYESSDLVYWTESGGVWHTFRDCSYLKKSKKIESGSVEKALESGKAKLCSACEKKQSD